MRKANYHTHSTYDDGKCTLKEMAEAARINGYEILGFSAHSPLPFETAWALKAERMQDYLAEIEALRPEFSGSMKILKGLEIDWLPGVSKATDACFRSLPLDYRLGSVHFVETDEAPFTIDESEDKFKAHFDRHFGSDGKKIVKAYYDAYSAMLAEGGFDIAGHFDLVKKNNGKSGIFDEEERWYRDRAFSCAEVLAAKDIVAEVNTGGLARGKTKDVYPAPFILKRMRELGIPLTICADAHHTDHLARFDLIAKDVLLACGYREIYVFDGLEWFSSALD